MDDSKKNITAELDEAGNGGAEYYDHGDYSDGKQFNDDEDFDDFLLKIKKWCDEHRVSE